MRLRRVYTHGQRRKGELSQAFCGQELTVNACRRFPVVSGFRVTWDSRKKPGQRVLSIALQVHKKIDDRTPGDSTPNLLMDFEEVKREGGRKYSVITREYMADGHDGFDCLKGNKMLIDDEQGQMMSTIVRKYLLGKCILPPCL